MIQYCSTIISESFLWLSNNLNLWAYLIILHNMFILFLIKLCFYIIKIALKYVEGYFSGQIKTWVH